MASTQFNSTSIVVDDRDPRITYSGVWSLGGTSGELVSTSHESNVTGSTATLIFNGTSVSVLGTVSPTDGHGAPVSSFTVDNRSPVAYTAPNTDSPAFQVPFFGVGGLEAGEHTLTITIKSDAQFQLDYILTCTDPPETKSSKPHRDTGPIVGGVLGGLALLFGGIFLLLWYRRRQHRDLKQAAVAQKFDLQPEISPSWQSAPLSSTTKGASPTSPHHMEHGLPYTSPPGSSYSTHAHSFSRENMARPVGNVALLPYGVSPTPSRSFAAQMTSSPTTPLRKGTNPLLAPPAARLHEDGGVRLEGGRPRNTESMIDVPPVYREY